MNSGFTRSCSGNVNNIISFSPFLLIHSCLNPCLFSKVCVDYKIISRRDSFELGEHVQHGVRLLEARPYSARYWDR